MIFCTLLLKNKSQTGRKFKVSWSNFTKRLKARFDDVTNRFDFYAKPFSSTVLTFNFEFQPKESFVFKASTLGHRKKFSHFQSIFSCIMSTLVLDIFISHVPSFVALFLLLCCFYVLCPRSLDQFYIVCYYRRWVKTSWTYSIAIRLFCISQINIVD